MYKKKYSNPVVSKSCRQIMVGNDFQISSHFSPPCKEYINEVPPKDIKACTCTHRMTNGKPMTDRKIYQAMKI